MFGKGGGALSAWLKEFCQLVFIQTIQAFIYAIVIIVIMELFDKSIESSAVNTQNSYLTGLGLFSVVALTSVFKVEDIVRKIFGFGATKADHGSAVKSIAKTAFAMKLGSRVLDNGKKMVGGAKAWLGSGKDEKKAADRLKRRKDALLKDNGMDGSNDSLPAASASTSNATSDSQRKIDSRKRDEKLRLFAEAQKARKMAQTETDPNKKKALIDQAKQKLAKSRAIDDTLRDKAENSTGLGGGNAAISSSPINATRSGDYHQKMLDLQEQYKKEISDAKKKRKEGFRTMTRGAAESVGAVIGATTGGILGFADGNIDEGIQGMVSGAGIGDAVGEFGTGVAFGATDIVEGAASSTASAVKDYSKSIKSQYEEEKKNVSSQIKDINKNAQQARKDLEKEVEMSAGQTAKAIAKAVGKGSVKAYKSRHGGMRQMQTDLKDLEKHIENSSQKIKLDNNVESID